MPPDIDASRPRTATIETGGRVLSNNPQLFWEIFATTGSPTAYILYRNLITDPNES